MKPALPASCHSSVSGSRARARGAVYSWPYRLPSSATALRSAMLFLGLAEIHGHSSFADNGEHGADLDLLADARLPAR